jgi:hypothetical protein
MERIRRVAAAMMAGGFLLASGTSNAESRCAELRLKPLRCICGTVINQLGEAVPDATVAILKDEMEIAAVQTGVDGKFSFDELKGASYRLQVSSVGYQLSRFPIVVQNPSKKCKKALEILLVGGLEACDNIREVRQ